MMHLSPRFFLYSLLLFASILLPITVSAESTVMAPSDAVTTVDSDEIDDEADADAENDDVLQQGAPLLDTSKDEDSFFSFLDTPQKFISTGVEGLAQTLDEFFSEDKVFYGSSGTFLQLTLDTLWAENGGVQYDSNIRLKIRLPHTSKKIKLTAQSTEEDRADETTAQTASPAVKAAEKKEFLAGIEAEVKKRGWEVKPSIGLRVSEVQPYVKLRLNRRFEFDIWSIYFNETAYWYHERGAGYDTILEFNKKITNKDLFRSTTFARRTHEIGHFELSHTFSMLHTLSDRRAVSYYMGAYGVSKPTVQSTHYVLGFNYRQKVHKDYLFFELIPQITYRRDNDFHAEHSLLFRIDIIFKK